MKRLTWRDKAIYLVIFSMLGSFLTVTNTFNSGCHLVRGVLTASTAQVSSLSLALFALSRSFTKRLLLCSVYAAKPSTQSIRCNSAGFQPSSLANSCICSKRGAGTEKSMRTILGASMSGIFNISTIHILLILQGFRGS